MITQATVRGGAPSSALALADHLLHGTWSETRDWSRDPPLPEGTAPVRADLHPDAAALLGVRAGQAVDRREAAALLAGRRADGGKIEGKRYVAQRTVVKNGKVKTLDPIGAYDFCFTPDKSVSVAWAFAGPAERAALLAAHRDGAEATMRAFEGRMGGARVGAGGRGGRVAGHVGWMVFEHVTGRPVLGDGRLLAADPDLHSHYSVPNAVWTESGRVGSLDTLRLRGFFHEARLLYHERLAAGLEALGTEVERVGAFGAATLKAIPTHVRDAFSKRTAQGEERARERARAEGKDWDALGPRDQARRRKAGTQARVATGDRALDAALRRDGAVDLAAWRTEAKGIGWTPATVFQGAVEKVREVSRELPVDPLHALAVKVEALRRGAAQALQRGELRRARAEREGRGAKGLADGFQRHREGQALARLAGPWRALDEPHERLPERMEVAVRGVVETMAAELHERGGIERGAEVER